MSQRPSRQSPKETCAHAHHKRVQRHTLGHAKAILRIRRDVEVRDDVSEESKEAAAGKNEEKAVFEGGFVKKFAGFAGTGYEAGATEEGGDGESGCGEGDEADCADSLSQVLDAGFERNQKVGGWAVTQGKPMDGNSRLNIRI